jgi:hypothetical protein
MLANQRGESLPETALLTASRDGDTVENRGKGFLKFLYASSRPPRWGVLDFAAHNSALPTAKRAPDHAA